MDIEPTPYESLQLAVERAGSQSEFARLCGVSQPSVWKWLNATKRLPAEHVLTVEAATGVSRHNLRPDIYPRGLREGEPFPFVPEGIAGEGGDVACDRRPLFQAEAAR